MLELWFDDVTQKDVLARTNEFRRNTENKICRATKDQRTHGVGYTAADDLLEVLESFLSPYPSFISLINEALPFIINPRLTLHCKREPQPYV